MNLNGKVGIGFRREFAREFLDTETLRPAFLEMAPENWIGMGGFWRKQLKKAAEKHPILCHGLSLSIGSPGPLDWDFVKEVKVFLEEYDVQVYSEHLSFSKCDNAHLYELLPIPFREDAVKHIAQRIREVQDFLERKIAIENVSYYTPVAAEMDELTFVNSILAEADCHLLFDVNNVYVNAFNHGYDAKEYIDGLATDRVKYIHMAGHTKVADDLIIDTHGNPIIDSVYDLFEYAIAQVKPVPVLLERDFNIPELEELQGEIDRLQAIADKVWQKKGVNHVA